MGSFTMKMTDEDRQSYPELRSYLEKILPDLPSRKPYVYAVWKRYIAANGDRSKLDWTSLAWGWDPLVKVSNAMVECYSPRVYGEEGPMAPRKVRWYGLTPNLDQIIIAEDLASLPGTPNEVVLENALLHEMIHWTRGVAEQSNWMDEDDPYAFEREAYGVSATEVLRNWNYCLPYVLDPSGSLGPYRQR
jgi:Metallopeptidase toxin 3